MSYTLTEPFWHTVIIALKYEDVKTATTHEFSENCCWNRNFYSYW